MGQRGRLIWPMKVQIAQIDTEATRTTDPDGAGPLTSGYDDIFEEPVLVPEADIAPGLAPEGSPRGDFATIYKAPITLKAQIEIEDLNVLRQMGTGQSPGFELRVVLHYFELEMRGLVNTDGTPMLQNNDKLLRIIKNPSEVLIREFTPELFAIRLDDRSFGLSGLDRNLLVITFQDRQEGVAIGA